MTTNTAPLPARTAYLVLGMHRSGTSAVTQLLALAGTDLPRHVMPGDEHNAKGYFEPWRIALTNDERLRAGDSAWDDAFAYPYRRLPDRAERSWINKAKAILTEEYGDLAHPLLKDPRVTVLLPLWRAAFDELGISLRCVIPVRHPLAVAGSLARRDGFPPEKSVLLWSAYMLAAEAYSRDLPRAFVSYDALLADWRAEAARIEAAHAAPLPGLTEAAGLEIDAFLTPELRHNAEGGDLNALGWTGEIAQAVLTALSQETPDRAALDHAAAMLAARAREIAPLVSPAARALDEALSELRETREARDFWKRQADLRGDYAELKRAGAETEAELDRILAETEKWLG